ncbi:MAG TPA: hypothetical protein VN688_25785 [Gemmataceae bacterium]|nr:hypothetical protein [Gemmataceae bacterium]
MEPKRPDPTPELVTVGLLPVQSFVVNAIPVPPGTPAKPCPDRPKLEEPGGKLPATQENGGVGPHHRQVSDEAVLEGK